MERETKEIILALSKSKVVMQTWITGREQREIANIYLNSETKDNKNLLEAQDKAIEMITVSIDEDTKNILDRVLDLPSKDYEQLLKEIMDVIGLPKDEKKN